MTAHRFFIRQSQIDANNTAKLAGRDARHIRLVLRLKKNSKISLVDEDRTVYLASIEKVTPKEVIARILESTQRPVPATRLAVVQGIPRLPKADFITQKLTELGIADIVFVPTEHSPYSNALERVSARMDRLQSVAESAAKQSLRTDIPIVAACTNLQKAVASFQDNSLLIVADEKNAGENLRELLSNRDTETGIALFIGPEGGFSVSEKVFLKEAGAASFSLGNTILRAETAAIVATAIVLYELEVI